MTKTFIPLLVCAADAATLLGIGKSLLYELNASGQIPQAVKLNSKSLWSYEQLKLWAAAGCPSRDSAAWQKILENFNSDDNGPGHSEPARKGEAGQR